MPLQQQHNALGLGWFGRRIKIEGANWMKHDDKHRQTRTMHAQLQFGNLQILNSYKHRIDSSI